MDGINFGSGDTKRILTRVQLLCVIGAVFLESLMIFIGKMNGRMFYEPFHKGLLLCSLIFAATLVYQTARYKIRHPLALSVAMVIWFTVVQIKQHGAGMTLQPYGMFISAYILAFPASMVLKDAQKQTVLKTAALMYIAAALVLVLYALLLIADCVPPFLIKRLFWNNYRLTVMHHPNISSRAFMIGFAMCIGGAAHLPRKWAKGLLLAIAVLIFFALSLTNSRTAILLSCALCGGVAFFKIYRGTWKQLLCGAMAGIVAALFLFGSSHMLFQWNAGRLRAMEAQLQVHTAQTPDILGAQADAEQGSDKTVAPEESQPKDAAGAAVNTTAAQNSLLQDAATLNGRTTIWRMAFRGIVEDPSILLWGCDNTAKLVEGYGANHTHNSWLEIFARLGLPGFLISILFSLRALWTGVQLLFRRDTDVWKKTVTMLALCLLLSGVLEPNLFFTEEVWHYADYMFFLCLGYMILWRKQQTADAD